jgi:hypothetical protein
MPVADLPLDGVEMRPGRHGEIVGIRCHAAYKDDLVRAVAALGKISGAQAIRASIGAARERGGGHGDDASPRTASTSRSGEPVEA